MFYLFKYLFSQENKQLSIDWTWEFNLKSLLNCICVRLCVPINYWYIFIYQLNTWYPFVIWQKYIILFSTQQFYLPDILIYILDPKNDPYRFKGEGVVFNAKLIGASDVPEARGDRMCQETILAQKMAVKTSGQHKQRIIINISEEGIKLIDLRTAVSVTITQGLSWGGWLGFDEYFPCWICVLHLILINVLSHSWVFLGLYNMFTIEWYPLFVFSDIITSSPCAQDIFHLKGCKWQKGIWLYLWDRGKNTQVLWNQNGKSGVYT